MDTKVTSEPFRIKTVERIYQSTVEQRQKWVEDVDFNMFYLRSDQVCLFTHLKSQFFCDHFVVSAQNGVWDIRRKLD